jgi:hypothetical protein
MSILPSRVVGIADELKRGSEAAKGERFARLRCARFSPQRANPVSAKSARGSVAILVTPFALRPSPLLISV